MNARKTISRIGWILVFFLIITTLAQASLIVFLQLFGQVLPQWLFTNTAICLLSQFCMYGIGFPVFVWMMSRVPACRMTQTRSLGGSRFLLIVIVCFGACFIGNWVGTGLMYLTEYLRGIPMGNPVDEMIMNMDLWMVILLTVILAPVMEEVMFRKYLVDRLVPFGQKTAVIVSGLMFGLAHGNFYQFFYAAALGMIFAWIYSFTGKLRYSIGLHMMINTVGGVLTLLIQRGLEADLRVAYAASLLLGQFALFTAVGAVVILLLYRKRIPWFPGFLGTGHALRSILTAPGFWGMAVVGMGMVIWQ